MPPDSLQSVDAIFRKGVLKNIQKRKTDLSLANEDELPSILFQAFTPFECWQYRETHVPNSSKESDPTSGWYVKANKC